MKLKVDIFSPPETTHVTQTAPGRLASNQLGQRQQQTDLEDSKRSLPVPVCSDRREQPVGQFRCHRDSVLLHSLKGLPGKFPVIGHVAQDAEAPIQALQLVLGPLGGCPCPQQPPQSLVFKILHVT